MAYSEQQTSHTVNFIAATLSYDDERNGLIKLSGRQKKEAIKLLLSYVAPSTVANPKKIIICPPNEKYNKMNKFISLFEELKKEKILLPNNTLFIMNRNGNSFIRQNNVTTEIFNFQQFKHKTPRSKYEVAQLMSLHSLRDDSDKDLAVNPKSYTPHFASTTQPTISSVQNKNAPSTKRLVLR